MNKTLLALMISASVISMPALAASVETNANGQATGNSAVRVQESQAAGELAAQAGNRTRVEADQQAVGQVRDNTENSARQAVSLGGSAAGEVRQSGERISGDSSADGSVDANQTTGLVVETADGVSIDLNSDTAADVAGSATASTGNLVGEGRRLSGSVAGSARTTGEAVTDNTRDSVSAARGAISVTSETSAELSGSVATSAVDDLRSTVEETRETVNDAAEVSADVQSTVSGTLEGNVNGGLL